MNINLSTLVTRFRGEKKPGNAKHNSFQNEYDLGYLFGFFINLRKCFPVLTSLFFK